MREKYAHKISIAFSSETAGQLEAFGEQQNISSVELVWQCVADALLRIKERGRIRARRSKLKRCPSIRRWVLAKMG